LKLDNLCTYVKSLKLRIKHSSANKTAVKALGFVERILTSLYDSKSNLMLSKKEINTRFEL